MGRVFRARGQQNEDQTGMSAGLEDAHIIEEIVNRCDIVSGQCVIAQIEMIDQGVALTFADGVIIRLIDDGQSCCEHRYATCDDNLGYYVGSTLMGVEVRPGASVNGDYGGVEETEFLIVTTNLGSFTVTTHNDHNGYYGGFALRAIRVSPSGFACADA